MFLPSSQKRELMLICVLSSEVVERITPSFGEGCALKGSAVYCFFAKGYDQGYRWTPAGNRCVARVWGEGTELPWPLWALSGTSLVPHLEHLPTPHRHLISVIPQFTERNRVKVWNLTSLKNRLCMFVHTCAVVNYKHLYLTSLLTLIVLPVGGNRIFTCL